MGEITTQAIMALSETMRAAAAEAVGSATFARFYDGRIMRLVREGVYQVAIDDRIVELPVYGNGAFQYGQHVYIVSPANSKEFSRMFILGIGGSATGESEDHEILMQLVKDVGNKLDAGIVVQEKGQSSKNVMSQKAVTDAINALKSDGIQGVVLGAQALPVHATNKTVTIPVAKENTLGVVTSTSQVNGVLVDNTGAMTVESLDVMRLTQKDDDTMVLDGGSATTWAT